MPALEHARAVEKAKEAFFSSPGVEIGVSSEILDSWARSKTAIGTPSNVHDVPHVSEDLLDGHLLDMFQAPLARLSDELHGSGVGLLLADAQGRIIQRWAGDRSAAKHLDNVGTDRGAVLSEEAVGTNGVGTVAATGRTLQISGAEHFASMYSSAVCTGSPVRHPLSGKLIAVVTLSSDLSETNRILKPFARSIAGQLEQQLLEAEQPEARAMLTAFLEASRVQGGGPVVAFGPQGLVMQSQKAGRLTAGDLNLLEQLCAKNPRSGRYVLELSLGTAELQVTALEGNAGAVVTLHRDRRATTTSIGPARAQLIGRSPEWLAAVNLVSRHRESRRPLIVAGEPGTGKTSLALGLPYRPGSGPAANIVVDAAERHLLGSRRWLQRVVDRLDASAPIVVRGVESLDANVLAGLGSIIERSVTHGSVLLTLSMPSAERAEEFAARLGLPMVWTPPLRERTADVELLWRFFAEALAPGAGLEPDQAALSLLQSNPWPRNLKELRSVVEELALSGKRGRLQPVDLPARLQGTRPLTMIERAELEAIRRALQEADGNRSRAAEILGLSRATIYRKMRAYRLTA